MNQRNHLSSANSTADPYGALQNTNAKHQHNFLKQSKDTGEGSPSSAAHNPLTCWEAD